MAFKKGPMLTHLSHRRRLVGVPVRRSVGSRDARHAVLAGREIAGHHVFEIRWSTQMA